MSVRLAFRSTAEPSPNEEQELNEQGSRLYHTLRFSASIRMEDAEDSSAM